MRLFKVLQNNSLHTVLQNLISCDALNVTNWAYWRMSGEIELHGSTSLLHTWKKETELEKNKTVGVHDMFWKYISVTWFQLLSVRLLFL